MSNQVTLYTMNYCPYCERAKALLKQRGVTFVEVRVAESDDATWESLEKKTGLKTMPQVFLNEGTPSEKIIGAYSDLAALDSKDQLASLK